MGQLWYWVFLFSKDQINLYKVANFFQGKFSLNINVLYKWKEYISIYIQYIYCYKVKYLQNLWPEDLS